MVPLFGRGKLNRHTDVFVGQPTPYTIGYADLRGTYRFSP